MFVDDILDGWLAVPAMGNLSGEESKASPEAQISSLSDYPRSHASSSTDPTNLELDASVEKERQPSPHASENASIEGFNSRKRRGHTKSRLGCIFCKQRKIKCEEQWPSCSNCTKRGRVCQYPTVFKHAQHDRIVSEVMSSPRPLVRLNDTPTMYSANDMRLFHYFLVTARPCIPDEFEGVWIKDVPACSHQYDYLMHGMLALAGTHVSIYNDDEQASIALSHRQKALTSLKEAFARWPPKAEEAHAMLATCYILAFQSGCMADGFLDHFLSMRGCAFITQNILNHGLQGMFSLDPDLCNTWIKFKFMNQLALDQQLVRGALRSLTGFLDLLSAPTTHDIEKALYTQLVEVMRPLLAWRSDPPDLAGSSSRASALNNPSVSTYVRSPLLPNKLATSYDDLVAQGPEAIATIPSCQKPDPSRSFDALMAGIMILNTWPQSEVLHIFSQTNKLGGLILLHLCCIRFLISTISAPVSATRVPIKGLVEWCEQLMAALDDDEEVKWTQFMRWPRSIVKTLRCRLIQNRGMTFGNVYDLLVKDPGIFREERAM